MRSRTIPRGTQQWLDAELAQWHAEGLVDERAAEEIRARYVAAPSRSSRSILGRILLGIGGTFLGIGLIWLVAANLDALAPGVRFGVVLALWLAALVAPEVLAARGHSRALVGSLRLVAALAFGAVIFQAAQSLQVPAYEPRLVGLWAAGALLHAVALRAVTAQLVGIAAGSLWWLWQPWSGDWSGPDLVLSMVLAAVLAVSVAAILDRYDRTLGGVWRIAGVAFTLCALFAAAIPGIDLTDAHGGFWLLLYAVAAGLALALGLTLGSKIARLEITGTVVVGLLALGMLAWETTSVADVAQLQTHDWLHAAASVLAYVLVATALTALGVIRSNNWITGLAMTGLIVFTTFQSFAVFAPIVTGAWLFVMLGVILLGTGIGVEGARRRLAHSLADETSAWEGDL